MAGQQAGQVRYGRFTGSILADQGNTRVPLVLAGKLHDTQTNKPLVQLSLSDMSLAVDLFRALRKFIVRRGDPVWYRARPTDRRQPGTLLPDRKTILLDTGDLVGVTGAAKVEHRE